MCVYYVCDVCVIFCDVCMYVMFGVLDLLCMYHVCSTLTLTLVGSNYM